MWTWGIHVKILFVFLLLIYLLLQRSQLRTQDFPDGSAVENPPSNAGDEGLISGLGRSPGGGNGNPLQYSYLENPMDRGAWWATVTKSPTWLSDWALMKPRTQKQRGRIIFSPIVWLLWCNFHFYDSSIETSILLSALSLTSVGATRRTHLHAGLTAMVDISWAPQHSGFPFRQSH